MAKKNQKTVAINNTTNTVKEEKNMKKNNNITGASVVMTKKGCGTITLNQPIIHGAIYLTVFNVTSEIVGDVSEKVKEFKAAGFEITKVTQHEAVAASPKKPITLAEQYRKNLAEINGKVNVEKKTASPKKPTDTEKVATDKVTKTREQSLTEKYGDLDTRRAYAQKRSTIWNEEAAKIAEEVKKTGKRLRKDAWKKLMNERVNARMAEAV